jgi:hypothetical protein
VPDTINILTFPILLICHPERSEGSHDNRAAFRRKDCVSNLWQSRTLRFDADFAFSLPYKYEENLSANYSQMSGREFDFQKFLSLTLTSNFRAFIIMRQSKKHLRCKRERQKSIGKRSACRICLCGLFWIDEQGDGYVKQENSKRNGSG